MARAGIRPAFQASLKPEVLGGLVWLTRRTISPSSDFGRVSYTNPGTRSGFQPLLKPEMLDRSAGLALDGGTPGWGARPCALLFGAKEPAMPSRAAFVVAVAILPGLAGGQVLQVNSDSLTAYK